MGLLIHHPIRKESQHRQSWNARSCSEEAGLVNTRLWKGKEYGDFLEAAWMEQNKRAEQGGFSDFLFCIHQRGQCVKLWREARSVGISEAME